MLLLALSLLSPASSSNNPRPFLGNNYIPLDAAKRLGAAFYFDNYCYNWKCWGAGNWSDTWIECYSISHICSTTWSTNSTGGEPVCDLAPQGYVTKDRLYCPERTNITGQEAYCRCYDNNRGEAKCGCTPIQARGQFPLMYILCPLGIVLLGGLYMLVRTQIERRMIRAQRNVPPYPVNEPPTGAFDLRMESSLVIGNMSDLPSYCEEGGGKLPAYDEVEGPPPAYPGEAYSGEYEVAEAGQYVVEQLENEIVEIPEGLTISERHDTATSEQTTEEGLYRPVNLYTTEEGFSVIGNPSFGSEDSKASMALEESIESNSGVMSDVI